MIDPVQQSQKKKTALTHVLAALVGVFFGPQALDYIQPLLGLFSGG